MSSQIKAIMNKHKHQITRVEDIRHRKHLNADALFTNMRTCFAEIRDHRSGKVTHTLPDTFMAGFAMFFLKDPSLLAFDERQCKGPHNIMTIYGKGSISCNTWMREILDGVDPNDLRPIFKAASGNCNRARFS